MLIKSPKYSVADICMYFLHKLKYTAIIIETNDEFYLMVYETYWIWNQIGNEFHTSVSSEVITNNLDNFVGGGSQPPYVRDIEGETPLLHDVMVFVLEHMYTISFLDAHRKRQEWEKK